jgi:type IV pilus assembly protein PilY1
MSTAQHFTRSAVAKAVLALYAVTHSPLVKPAPTVVHTEPLATAGNSVPPNLMFILDDSGSMQQDYTPDYINDALCRDAWEDIRQNPSGTDASLSHSSADSRDDNSQLDTCQRGDPLFSAYQTNTQWYNPSFTYLPGYDPSLTPPAALPQYLSKSNMTNYNTAARWAIVQNDPYTSDNPTGTTNIIFGNQDVVYCNITNPTFANLFDTTRCRTPVDSTFTVPIAVTYTGPTIPGVVTNGAVLTNDRNVWRYPNSPRAATGATPITGAGTFQNNFVVRVARTGTAANPVPPFFYTVTQVGYCINNYTNQVANTFSPSKFRFGKGAKKNPVTGVFPDAANRCHDRRFNDTVAGTNFQYPRFGLIPHVAADDTALLNRQEPAAPPTPGTTDNSAARWSGMSGWTRHEIVETAVGSNTLPATYPSRASSQVYSNRVDCNFAPCTYTQEMTNYANWHAYYRFRMLMMKTAAGLAFYDVDDRFRVGFITINPGSPVDTDKYLPLEVFTPAQKVNFYTKFYQQAPGGSTPLRQALARVGRHYAGVTAGINSGMNPAPSSLNPLGVADSMTASCQKNFALLTSDGYWNSSGGQEIGGAAMGDHDNTDPRPFFDGPGVQGTAAATSTGTLADVAMYYYKTDLRPAVMAGSPAEDIWENNVQPTGADTATHQHMTTFTLGLGLDGILEYQANYNSNPPPAGDFADVVSGAKNWPVPGSAGGDEKALDDLWHAAVNGRGKFFSARDPAALAQGLAEALGSINSITGAGAAAATSNLQPVAGDNWAFTAEYQTVEWSGDVKARTIDLSGGIISAVSLWSARTLLDSKCTGAACLSTVLRKIWTFTGDTANFPNKVKDFSWANGAGTAYPADTNFTTTEQAFFNPAQFVTPNSWNGTQLAAATAKNVVDFLRGDRSKEDTGASLVTDLFRARVHVLGDIISAQPVYIKAPPFAYTDNGYLAYQATNANRLGTLYVASNDGMLHAVETDPDANPFYQINGISTPATADDTFSGGSNDGGVERWTFVPSRVVQNMYRLGTTNYQHRWFVDGTPIVEDFCDTAATGTGTLSTPAYTCPGAGSWKTILVGGLNGGGRGYYALDITNPSNPVALWEFNARDPSVTACAATIAAAIGQSSDCDLGLSFGNPITTKLPLGHPQSGKWVTIVSSGYNNYKTVDGAAANTGGDGNGYLYILDAKTGTIIEKIQTCSGSGGTAAAAPPYSDADPCGFTKLNTYHHLRNEKVDNSPIRVYGTTVKGELWRVDLTKQVSPQAHLVATFKDALGNNQPITTPPEMFLTKGLDAILYSNPWEAPAAVFVGTGRYLGVSDRSDLSHQSVYAIKDQPGVTSTLANARSSMQARTFTAEFTDVASGQTRRNVTGGTSDAFTSASGWYLDFPDVGSPATATGERVNVEFRIVQTTLVLLSNIPKINACVAGGTSWLNFIDVNTGAAIVGLTTPYASVKLAGSLGVGISPIQIGDKIKTIVTTADNQQLTFDTPIEAPGFQGARVQWRELTQ